MSGERANGMVHTWGGQWRTQLTANLKAMNGLPADRGVAGILPRIRDIGDPTVSVLPDGCADIGGKFG